MFFQLAVLAYIVMYNTTIIESLSGSVNSCQARNRLDPPSGSSGVGLIIFVFRLIVELQPAMK